MCGCTEPNNLPPLPHSHTKNGSAQQRNCLGGSSRAAAMAMSGRWRRRIRGLGGGGGGGGGGRGWQQHSLRSAHIGVGLLMRRLALCPRGPGWHGGAAALALLGSRQGYAADVSARAAPSRPRAKVGGGSAMLTGASVDVCRGDGAGRGGSSGSSACVGVRPLTRWQNQTKFLIFLRNNSECMVVDPYKARKSWSSHT